MNESHRSNIDRDNCIDMYYAGQLLAEGKGDIFKFFKEYSSTL